VRAVQAGSGTGVFVGLGRELYSWLDGTRAAERAAGAGARPVVFEVAGAAGGGAGGAAGPFELLAVEN